jgi:hypothetical protein
MTNDSEKLIGHCVECGDYANELTNNKCNDCLSEIELKRIFSKEFLQEVDELTQKRLIQ